MDCGEVDQRLSASGQAFIIASQAPLPDQPAKGALDFPALPVDLKTAPRFFDLNRDAIFELPFDSRLVGGLWDNLGGPSQVSLDPVDQGTGVGFVGKQVREAREAILQRLQEQRGSHAIHQTRCMHLDRERVPLRINQEMPFATPDFFSQRRTLGRFHAQDWF